MPRDVTEEGQMAGHDWQSREPGRYGAGSWGCDGTRRGQVHSQEAPLMSLAWQYVGSGHRWRVRGAGKPLRRERVL